MGAPAASRAPSGAGAASKGLGGRVVAGGALIVVALVLASALRLQGAEHSALAFHPIRQYASLAVAKARYEAMSKAPETSTSAAVQENARAAPRLEPRLLEWVVALGYLALGREDRGLGASLSSVIWVGGGLLLFRLGRRLGSPLAAGVAAAFHLFLPYGIIASRSFQPDPAMVTLMIAGLLAVVRHHERPSVRRLAWACGLSGAAILVKPASAFLLVGVHVALAMRRHGVGPTLGRSTAAFVGLSALPSGVVYLYSVLSGTDVESFARGAFQPGLWVDPVYWRGWVRMVDGTVGLVMVAVAVAAVATARRPAARSVMAGALAGYTAFGLVFTYHVHTHDYYQLPLVPIVGLGVGLTVDAAVARFRSAALGAPASMAAGAAAAFLAASFAVSAVRSARPLPGGVAEAAIAESERIGDLVGHSTRTVMLAPAHGWPLRHDGRLSGSRWPFAVQLDRSLAPVQRELAAAERLDRFVGAGATWFIVTDLEDLARQPELDDLLRRVARLEAEGDGWAIFVLGGRR